jgi:fructose-1,6-bisphosphatase II / sedoheptulose-1,7-bisphosphatase
LIKTLKKTPKKRPEQAPEQSIEEMPKDSHSKDVNIATDAAETLNRTLSLELVRVTEASAVAAARLMGRGDEREAEESAVAAMRAQLDQLDIDGEIVIGEGDAASEGALRVGEKVGTGKGPKVDIAVDPVEGTTLTAKAMPNAMAVIALAARGALLKVPPLYMEKVAIGRGYEEGIVSLEQSPAENIRALARARAVEVGDITACVLDRPRHARLVAEIREAGARVALITDGDIAGVIHTSDKNTGIDIYLGQGGAPEGVLAAAALRCVGGQMQGRLVYRNDDDKKLAYGFGIEDLNRIYTLDDMAAGDVIFAATGITNGSMLAGVKFSGAEVTSQTVVMRSSTGTVRWITGRHLRSGKFG